MARLNPSRCCWLSLALMLAACDGERPPTTAAAPRQDAAEAVTAIATVADDLPAYEPEAGVAGRLVIAGDAATAYLAEQWAAAYQRVQPGAQVEVMGIETTRAQPWWSAQQPPPLSVAAGPMDSEALGEYARQRGFEPRQIPVALDALAVVVNRANPLAFQGLPLEAVAAVFSPKPGTAAPPPLFWRRLGTGTDGGWAARPVVAVAPDSSSPLYRLAQRLLLDGRAYGPGVVRRESGAAVVQAVADREEAIGIAPRSVLTGRVGVLALQGQDGGVLPVADAIAGGRYPLRYRIFLALHYPRGQTAPSPLRRDLIRFILSRAGQEVAAKAGFVPLSAPQALSVDGS